MKNKIKQSIVKIKENLAGKWVAFLNNRPVLWEETLKELMNKLKKKGMASSVSVMLVPHKSEGPYIL